MAGTYYAQAREYQADVGRFQGMDVIPGSIESPFTQNGYNYCFGNPMVLVDFDGAWPEWIVNIGKGISTGWKQFTDGVSHVWNTYIYGEDITVTITTPQPGMAGVYTTQTVTEHRGGSIIVAKVENGNRVGVSLNIPSIKISDDTSIGVPTSIGINWGEENLGITASTGIEAKIKGVGLKVSANATINSSDWLSAGVDVGYIYKNRINGLGARAALNPMSTWNLYLFNTIIRENITYKSETGVYVRALIPELVVVVIVAILFPQTIPALAKVAEELISIGVKQLATLGCGI